MSEGLTCARCGMTATHADAYIADIEESCEKQIRVNGRTTTVSAEHKWKEV